MSVFPCRSWLRIASLLVVLLVSLTNPSSAQFGGGLGGGLRGMGGTQTAEDRFKSPTAYQVFQRDLNGQADIPIILPDSLKDVNIISVYASFSPPLSGAGGMNGMGMHMGFSFPSKSARFQDGKLIGLATGGPHFVQVRYERKDKSEGSTMTGPFYVGDLWVLAGQSNMQGVGDLDTSPQPTPNLAVMALGMNGQWGQAVEPLHWLIDSPDPVHSGDAATRAKRSEEEHKTRTKGTGLGLPFANALYAETHIPIGLVPCAHGGTSMEQWNPNKKGEGGKSLYGSMLRQVKLAGGKVKGVLWYQGESDSMQGQALADAYSKTFSQFIAAVRDDLGQADLPFYFVQIGRFINGSDPKPWHTVQDTQRTLPETVPNTGVISVIDLPLDDGIHVGTAGLIRAGHRLAKVVLRDQFGLVGATTPTLDRVVKGRDHTLVVKFKNVNRLPYATINSTTIPISSGGLQPERHIAGFSIHMADGKEIPLIYEAMVNTSRDAVVLKLSGEVPAGASLWYGWGLNPYCNLTDTLDMAVPVFGPIALDKIN